MRHAAATMQGLQFAKGGQLPVELFDALALSEEEAYALTFDTNVQRVIEQAVRDAGRG